MAPSAMPKKKKEKKEAISFVSCDIYRAGRGLVSSDGLEHACTRDLDVDGCCRVGIPRIGPGMDHAVSTA